jgi:serine phosphatase RsbU (regulator of sigma subunit)/tetratricopeptide (TPR) repeat protein
MKKNYSIALLFLFTCFFGQLNAQSNYVDSLNVEVKKSESDTHTVALYLKIAKYFNDRSDKEALQYANKAIELSTKNDFQKGLAGGYGAYALGVGNQGDLTQELDYHNKALKIWETLGDNLGQAKELGNMAIAEWSQGDYTPATDHCLQSIRLYEKAGDAFGVEVSQMTLGNIYLDQKNYDESLKCYQDALKGNVQNKYSELFNAQLMSNIANIYNVKGDYEKAIPNYQAVLPIFEKAGRLKDKSVVLNNIGTIYENQKKYDEALKLFRESYSIRNAIGDSDGVCSVFQNIGNVYNDQKHYDSAQFYYDHSLAIAKYMHSRSQVAAVYSCMATNYASMGKFEDAYKYQTMYLDLNDSLVGAENMNSVNELRAKFDAEKRDRQIKDLETKGILEQQESAVEKEKSGRRMYLMLSIILVVLLVAIVFYSRNRTKSIVNQQLQRKNEEITMHQKSISDSINYAKKIQDSILPPQSLIDKVLPEGFILYEPKDVVSGDFYWLDSRDGLSIFSAVDCTGHGVPGAMMSVVGFNLLNQAVNEMGLTKPSDILHHLDFGVNKLLRQSDGGHTVKDGMDLSVCTYDPKTKKLQFAGVFNPAYIISKGQLKQINADKFPIGTNVDGVADVYTNNEIQLFSGDMIYLFSDGYADQFGGAMGKKFKYNRFRELLLKIHAFPARDQRNTLREEFINWKGNLEQVDDILVIGMRVA